MATIADVMNRELVTVPPSTTVSEAATTMGLRRVGSVLVLEGGRLAGIFTERDVVKALSNDINAASTPVTAWMTRNPTTISPDSPAEEALGLMLGRHFRHLPVMQGGELVGMVSIRDLSRLSWKSG